MSTTGVMKQPTILVVDDSVHDYETYVRYLSRTRPNQYKTKFFSAGRHVFSSLEEKPHCLLLDLSLPDMTGLEILQKLKEQHGGSLPFPVVMVTGSGDETTGQKAVRLGAQDYLIKDEVTEESLPRSIEFAAARFRLEQKLRASEDRYRRLSTHMKLAADAADLGVWSFDLTSGAIDADENNRRALGLPLTGPLKYEDFLGTVYEADRSSLQAVVSRCLETGVPYDQEFRVMHKDGSIFWIASRGSVIRKPDGTTTGMAGIAIDITERKKIEEKILKSEEKYRRLAESLDAEVRARTSELELRNAEILRQSEALRDLSANLLQTQDEERRRIARELHDSAGQVLSALGMSLASMSRSAQDPSRFSRDAAESQKLVQQLTQEIRTMSYLLHPPLLDECGLAEALRWYIDGIKQRSGLDTRLNISEELGRLTAETELVIFRLVQECLTNVHRHSGSSIAFIRIASEGGNICLEIQDQGKGIPQKRLAEIQSQGSGVGIRGMRERIRPFGGQMHITSDHRGTTISFVFPLAGPKETLRN